MVSGRKIIKAEATNQETKDKVIVGEAEVDHPVSAYMFTCQAKEVTSKVSYADEFVPTPRL